MSETKPALTPERWAEAAGRDILAPTNRAEMDDVAVFTRTPHEHAALLLHGQPFGFTWEDVDEIRSTARDCERKTRVDIYPKFTDEDRDWNRARAAHLHGLADRIAALLPPREEAE